MYAQWAKKRRSSFYNNVGSFCCICRPNYLWCTFDRLNFYFFVSSHYFAFGYSCLAPLWGFLRLSQGRAQRRRLSSHRFGRQEKRNRRCVCQNVEFSKGRKGLSRFWNTISDIENYVAFLFKNRTFRSQKLFSGIWKLDVKKKKKISKQF